MKTLKKISLILGLLIIPGVAFSQLVGVQRFIDDIWFAGGHKAIFGNPNKQMTIYNDGTNGIIDVSSGTVSFPHGISAAISGNASTATALAVNPTDCSSNQFANAIAANGNLTCAGLVDADVPDALTISGGTVNNSIIGGTTPAAATFTTISANGAVTFTSATNIGWSVRTGANTACNTTCTNACVFGQDTDGATKPIVDCADTTADRCVCAGSN